MHLVVKYIDVDRTNEITKLVKQGFSLRVMAKKLDISPTTVRYWLNKLNLKVKKSLLKNGSKPTHHFELIGKTFGYLKIMQVAQTAKSVRGTYRAICECFNCGRTNFETSIQNILRGSTTSCGCRRDWYEKLRGKNSSQFTGYEEIGGSMWKKIEEKANIRNIPFNISIKDAYNIFIKQDRHCALSGLPITISNKRHTTTASLDRIDSKGGYEIKNVQWVSKNINLMKNSLDENKFIKLCKAVAKFND